jgi:hypothetical protein
MAPKADGGGTVDVTPDEVNIAAGTFAKQQDQLGDVWSALASSLSPGMAGNDGGAQKFAAKYDPAAQAVWKAFGSAVRVIGGTAKGLVQTANNYVKAEHHSTTGSKQEPDRYPPPAVADDITVGGPDPAEGEGHSSVPDWLAQYWPNGDPDRLRAAASAWRTARDGVDGVTTTLHGAVAGITDYNNADDITQMAAFWDSLAKLGDKSAILTGLHDACDSIAKACDAYAQAIDDARGNLETALAEAGIAVALTTVVGILLTPFTLGGSDAAAGAADAAEVAAIAGPLVEEFETTVVAEVGEAIAEDVAIDLETTAAAVPDIEAAEVEVADVDATVEEELAQAEGRTELPEEPTAPADQPIKDIFEPDGEPIGEPGNSPGVRTMSEQDLERTWTDIESKYGPAKTIQTGKGTIEYVETPGGGRIQLRDFSKSGGKTIDINVDGVGIDKIHVK